MLFSFCEIILERDMYTLHWRGVQSSLIYSFPTFACFVQPWFSDHYMPLLAFGWNGAFNVSALPSDVSSCNDKNVSEVRESRRMSLKSYVRNGEINCSNVAKIGSFCVLSLNLSQSSTLLFIPLESASHTKSNYRAIMLLSTGLDLLLGFVSVVNASSNCNEYYVHNSTKICQMSVYLNHMYILFDYSLEVLSPFKFVSFYGSSLQLACHCLRARNKSVNFFEALHCFCRGDL